MKQGSPASRGCHPPRGQLATCLGLQVLGPVTRVWSGHPWFMPDACVDHYLSLASLKSRFEAMGWCHAVCSSGTP